MSKLKHLDISPLLEAINQESPAVRSSALRVLILLPLTRTCWFQIQSILQALITHAEIDLARNSGWLAELIEAASYVPLAGMRAMLKRMLASTDLSVRSAAAHSLARTFDADSLPQLVGELLSEDRDVRRRARLLSWTLVLTPATSGRRS